jgi:serine-type anaerobic sulfatase-maturating enzyme
VSTALREFQVMVKPMGAICNLDCHYCYYLKKEFLYPKGDDFHMSDEMLERYILQQIEAAPGPMVNFAWHGGEPTALGLDYFQKIVALQKKHRPDGKKITNGIQTNGTLLDDGWCRFFAAERFAVGLSIDGPRELHDAYRVDKGQKPTHKQVVRAFRMLSEHDVHIDVLCVVHDKNVRHPREVYRYFKELGVGFLQFLPLVERENGGVSSRTAPAEAFGKFLIAVFDEWLRNDIGKIAIQMFDEAARPLAGMDHSLCIFRETCGDVPVVEHNGDFFSCDHFVDPEYRVGNIAERHLGEMVDSAPQRAFGEAKRDSLPRYCRECEVRAMCNGGCPKDRFIHTPDGEPGLNYLCAGYKSFFLHSRPYLKKMVELWEANQPIEKLMEVVRADEAPAPPQAGRNDACPCGSGKKYKRCCGAAR